MTFRSATRMVELDGLRGVAILAVVVAHYFGEVPHGLRFLTAGWLGVELFFVLSGFLIGGILLDNRESPNLFGVFYLRRALRIFPVYYAVLAVLFLAHAVPDSLPAGTYLSYTQNIFMALSGRIDGFWLLPTWTLAVEEQFYLLLPLTIVIVPRRYLPAVAVGAIVSAPLLRAVLLAGNPSAAGALTLLPCRWDALFLGVLAAYALREPGLRRHLVRPNALQWIALTGALGVLGSTIFDKLLNRPFFDVFGYSFVALCFAALVLAAVVQEPMGRRFRSALLRRLGCISYCVYLIHQPISGALHRALLHANPDIGSAAGFAVTMLALVCSVAVASMSWTYFESRLIALGHRWSYQHAAAVPLTPLAPRMEDLAK
jgi:peptidoglycan/LPS O-acetylase OafA/YrhL